MPNEKLKEQFEAKFVVIFGEDAESHDWGVVVQSLENGAVKSNSFTKKNLKGAVTEAYLRMRRRELHNRRFPPEAVERSRIIKPGIITMPNGR